LKALLKVWEWAEKELTKEKINKLLLATDNTERTVWRLAASRGESEILQKLWELAKEKLTTEEINELLLTTDNMGRTAWHLAVEGAN
jgi:hypothetical protein